MMNDIFKKNKLKGIDFSISTRDIVFDFLRAEQNLVFRLVHGGSQGFQF